MINREILYERNLTGSYMKIPVAPNAGFDEKIMLKKKLPGLLPVERCFVNGHGQYWYNISGKQSLDTFCKLKSVGVDFMERMIISICNEIEILEWNLMNVNCLVLDPELVFITNQNGEIIFSVYPGEHNCLEQEFQHLMEYMITKIDHSDALAVQRAYEIYQKTFEEGYSVVDIRDNIINRKDQQPIEEIRKTIRNTALKEKKDNIDSISEHVKEPIKDSIKDSVKNSIIDSIKVVITTIDGKMQHKAIFDELWKKIKHRFVRDRSKFEENKWKYEEIEDFNVDDSYNSIVSGNSIVSENAIVPENSVYSSNPTVCLRNISSNPRGMLLYDGIDDYENISISGDIVRVGKNHEVDVIINKETISGFHAKIEREKDTYYIEDLNSTNGTAINGEPLNYKEKRILKINDVVEFADLKYRFV